jgi:hypothetical protein
MPRITRRWPTQCAGVSTCPYIIVAVVGMPSSCAVVMISIQAEAGSLPLVSTQPHVVVEDLGRGAGVRVDAGLPGPLSHSRTASPVRAAPLTTSIGENACTCMSGQRPFTCAAMSK